MSQIRFFTLYKKESSDHKLTSRRTYILYIKHITCIHSNQFKIPMSNENMHLVLAYQTLCEIVLFMYVYVLDKCNVFAQQIYFRDHSNSVNRILGAFKKIQKFRSNVYSLPVDSGQSHFATTLAANTTLTPAMSLCTLCQPQHIASNYALYVKYNTVHSL